MNQKEKLIELLSGINVLDYPTANFTECIADYLLVNGVIVLPCKVGDVVYVVYPVQGITEQKVKRFQLGSYGLMFATGKGVRPVDDFGKTVFLTREEAEKALRERDENVLV